MVPTLRPVGMLAPQNTTRVSAAKPWALANIVLAVRSAVISAMHGCSAPAPAGSMPLNVPPLVSVQNPIHATVEPAGTSHVGSVAANALDPADDADHVNDLRA